MPRPLITSGNIDDRLDSITNAVQDLQNRKPARSGIGGLSQKEVKAIYSRLSELEDQVSKLENQVEDLSTPTE